MDAQQSESNRLSLVSPTAARRSPRNHEGQDYDSVLNHGTPYDSDEHIGYVACKKPISLVRGAYMFSARSVYV